MGVDYVMFPDADGDIVQKVADINPDLISLGIILPSRDGYSAIKLLKSDDRTKNIPVIFLDNLAQEKDIQKGVSLGAIDYFVTAEHTPDEVIKGYINYLKNPKLYVPQ